jgi:hypothetical protein
MTKRQQRNITVTSMLVTVVLVFLVCHSFKLIINGYEVYQHMMAGYGGGGMGEEEPEAAATVAEGKEINGTAPGGKNNEMSGLGYRCLNSFLIVKTV